MDEYRRMFVNDLLETITQLNGATDDNELNHILYKKVQTYIEILKSLNVYAVVDEYNHGIYKFINSIKINKTNYIYKYS